MGGGSPIPGHVLAPVSALRRSVLSWWSYRSAAFPPTSVIFFPSSSAAADRQSDGNKSAVHKRHSISVCITCTSQIVRRLSLMYAIQGIMSAMPWTRPFHTWARLPPLVASCSYFFFLKRVEVSSNSSLFLSRQYLHIGPFSVDTFHAAAAVMTDSRVDFSRTVPRPKFSGLSKFFNHGDSEPRRGAS